MTNHNSSENNEVVPTITNSLINPINPKLLKTGLNLRVGVMASGEGTNFQALAEASTYSMNLDFETEPFSISIPLVGDYDVPSFPIENNSEGEWLLIDNESTLLATDSTTGTEASYVIISLTNETAIISGVMPFTQDVAGMAIDLDIEIEMILEKQ